VRPVRVLVLLGLALGGWGPVPVREIPVTIATDAAFRRHHGWRELARKSLEEATADLEELAGLRFVPAGELTWEPAGGVESVERLLDEAAAALGPRPGLTAVFTGQHPPRPGHWSELGYAYLGRPMFIVALPRRGDIPFASYLEKELVHYVRHELGHVFGIPHLNGRNVMSDDPARRAREFTEIAVDILRANRNLDFGAATPFAGSDLETLRDAYLLLDSRGECEPALLTNLAVAFRRERRLEEARQLYEASLRRNHNSAAARLGLAQTMLDLGDTLRARSLADVIEASGGPEGSYRGVLGGLRVRLGDPGHGRRLLTEALAADSTQFTTWFFRGLASFRLEDYESARRDFERALDREERAEAWFNLGLVGDALGDAGCVRRSFTRFLELAPSGEQAEAARKFLERHR
jgi:hypothetical protein